MAYMNQEKKATIKAELMKVMPADWKWSLAVRNHSTLILTIRSAPINLLKYIKFRGVPLEEALKEEDGERYRSYWRLNEYYLEESFTDDNLVQQFLLIRNAMNLGNWDRSDIQSDYFDVGHYITINIGTFEKPFKPAGEALNHV